MKQDFGRPPRADEIQDLVARRLKDASATGSVRETLTVEWRGQPLHVEVIDMPTDVLYFNPATHRIRAQRSHDDQREQTLDSDAWSPDSQDYLRFLLKALPADPSRVDPDFTELLESLRAFQQTDPGLITRDGIVVNGNTRLAALRDLGKQTIRVGVLPESCEWSDISAVELSLQLRKDHRRDYSYINRLLAIDEQASQGIPLTEVARQFRTTATACEQDVWILGFIREAIERSQVAGAKLRLVDFEDHAEKLKELRRSYAKVASINHEDAELLKEARMAAIVLGFSKTDVRLIEQDFQARYLDAELPQELKRPPETRGSVAIPGLNRLVQGPAPRVAAARALTDSILQARAIVTSGDGLPATQVTEASRVVSDAKKAMEGALEPAGKDARVRKRKQAAPARLADARRNIEQCTTDLVVARGSRSLDEDAFDDAVTDLRKALAKLAREARVSVSDPGEGVTWLLDIARRGS